MKSVIEILKEIRPEFDFTNIRRFYRGWNAGFIRRRDPGCDDGQKLQHFHSGHGHCAGELQKFGYHQRAFA